MAAVRYASLFAGMKVCVDCGATHARKGGAKRCAACARERHRRQQAVWRAEHAEEQNARSNARYWANREARLAADAARYRRTHPPIVRVCARDGCEVEFTVDNRTGKKRFHAQECQQIAWYEANRPRVLRLQRRGRRLARRERDARNEAA